MFDKGVPLENAEELCTKVQRMLNSYNDLSAFLTAQFDATSLIENILSQNIRVIPDFNATLQNKGLINTDKLSDTIFRPDKTRSTRSSWYTGEYPRWNYRNKMVNSPE